MSARWNLHDWQLELDALCMTYWGETAGVIEPYLLRHYWGLCLSPQQTFETIAKNLGLELELPESQETYTENENAPAMLETSTGAVGRTLKETCTATYGCIIPAKTALSQAVRTFRKTYPHYADKDRLKTARKLIDAGAVRPANDAHTAFDVGTLGQPFHVENKKCSCGERHVVCEHRLAVVLVMDADKIEMARRLDASEHHAVLHEEQDPADDPHGEHGTWLGKLIHQCADNEVMAVPPTEPGERTICPRCQQPYCPACDAEANDAAG
ncbi:MAG: hypothetical protein HY868_16605 [Chloroflexi bacterium]|nr:hypothetical protein [Chloroflexota bacterium]